MKTFKIFLISVFFINMTFAQETASRFFGIKNYVSMGYEKGDINFLRTNDVGFVLDSVQHFDIKILQPAFNIFTKKGHFHEFAITELQLLKEETVTNYQFDGMFGSFSGSFGYGIEKKNNVGLRYQFNYALVNKKMKGFIGLGFDGYYQMEKSIPDPPEDGSTTRLEWHHLVKGLNIHVAPRVIVPISEKLFLDFNALFTVYKIERTDFEEWQSIDNQELINFNHTLSKVLPVDFECAIGIGYKIERQKK